MRGTVLPLLLLAFAGCGASEPADQRLSEAVRARAGGRRVTPLLRVAPDRDDAWVLRFEGTTRADLVLPSFPAPGQPERRVSRRTPHLFWSTEGDRLVTETIGGGFLVVYFPEGRAPFACPHRLLKPTDVPLAWDGTPTLDALVDEMLTDPARPHDAEEQQIAFARIRRAGESGERGKVLVQAALRASAHVDEDGLAELLSQRLAALPSGEREREIATLAAALGNEDPPESWGAAAPRIARALGEAGARDFESDLGAAMARVVRISRAPTNAPKVVGAATWIAWAAGRLRASAARDPLRAFLDVPYEVPFKTRVARSVAAWALVRLGDPEVLGRVARWNGPLDRTLPATGAQVPTEAEMEQSPEWAETVSSWATAEWARRSTAPAPR